MATFEQFIKTFPQDSQKKGERFEIVLCDWFLRVHPEFRRKFKRVWRYTDWPGKWHGTDLGTDLIAEDTEGKICAIQAKFYSESNSVSKGEVDSFLSDSARQVIDYRLLIATTDKIGLNATVTLEQQEKPVHLFLLNDFLESRMEWPESCDDLVAPAPKPLQPRPHQQEAIANVVANINERGQLIMACGTGKSLTGQRIAEKLESETTLILLPSLLLLSKTINDWATDGEVPFSFLPVCSDATVTQRSSDSIELSTSELSFQPTTDASEIASFLSRPGNKVIFSTYQSSPQIAAAFKSHDLKPFDLIIADEAHRCAGKTDSAYGTVLDGDALPAKHRIFMTATPRVYHAHLRAKAAENDIDVASMDDESVFGPVLHKLSFGEAIERKLLSDYRVVVVGVNDAMVREMVMDRTLVKTDTGIEDDARSLATQVGLAKAIKDYDLKRVISFHSRVDLAKNFSSDFHTLLDWLDEQSRPSGKLTYEYVSGAMPTSARALKLRSLRKLEDEDRYLLANARCLSEGVDVPTLDGVAFVDPKRSEIDIVQAVGRAIRLDQTNEDKIGTVVIPVFIEEGDDPAQVIDASEFDQVWKVLTALRSHDEKLGEELDELRTQMGRKQKISIVGDKIRFDVHKSIDASFTAAFETRLVEATTAPWMFWFGLLEDYRQAEGDCDVPQRYKAADGFSLGSWLSDQRKAYKKGKLSDDRVRRLKDLGALD